MSFSRLLAWGGIAVASLSLLLNQHAAQAATTLSAGSLIKASGPDVYYFSADGKRYAFPDQATYRSWYSDFSGVVTISDADLAAISFGGIVTLRPGVTMVKVTTDPKVYAVSRGGVLHWVASEALAQSLYGTDWNRHIIDVPDAFFPNYQIRSDIQQASDLSPQAEQAASLTIDADLASRRALSSPVVPPTNTTVSTSTPPTTTTSTTSSTPTSSTSINPASLPIAGQVSILNNGPFTSGDTVTVVATVTRGFADRILVNFGGTSTTQGNCLSSPCRIDWRLPNVATTTNLDIQAIFQTAVGTSYLSNTSTASLTVRPSAASGAIHITAPTTAIYGNNVDFQADVDNSISARSIQITLDGNTIHTCDLTQTCQYTKQESGSTGSTHTVGAIVTTSDYVQIYSNPTRYQVVQ